MNTTLKNETITVTGGAGFLGSFLCESLVQKGHHVICVDNFYTGSLNNINHLRDYKNFELIRHDITFPLYLETDKIFNLACPASPIHYQRDPIFTVKTNVNGSINMLGLASRTNSRIFQASTSEVYGDPLQHPQKEDYNGNVNPIGPRGCYDEGKRCAETLFFDYFRQRNVDIRVGRIFNTYGPRMQKNDGRVVSNFIIQALKNEEICVYGNGNQTRSFCYVDDLIFGIEAFMNQSKYIGPINIGNPCEIKVLDLALLIRKLTNSSSPIVTDDWVLGFKEPIISKRDDDPKCRKPDITLAKNLFDWKPKVTLEEGLMNTISYFDKIL